MSFSSKLPSSTVSKRNAFAREILYLPYTATFATVKRKAAILLLLFALLANFMGVATSADVPKSAKVNLRVKGPPSVVIQLKAGRTATGHSVHLQNSAPLGLWCQAVDANSREVIRADSVTFIHRERKYNATFSDASQRNATLTREQTTVDDAGRWTCFVTTREYGNATGEINVYLRPVINTALRVDDRSSSKFHFDLSGLTVVRGEEAKMECPASGNPKPTIRWRKNGQDLNITNSDQSFHSSEEIPDDDSNHSWWAMKKYLEKIRVESAEGEPRMHVKNGVLTIRNVTDADGGTYTCTATNTFTHKANTQTFEVKADRHLRIKSKYAWLPPLILIIVILVLLFATIWLCGKRERRNEQKLLETEED